MVEIRVDAELRIANGIIPVKKTVFLRHFLLFTHTYARNCTFDCILYFDKSVKLLAKQIAVKYNTFC